MVRLRVGRDLVEWDGFGRRVHKLLVSIQKLHVLQ
jgi:hypothetical protein